ncbi:hypothetical protein BGZ73_000373, partial [Actinomortierella ambigua]
MDLFLAMILLEGFEKADSGRVGVFWGGGSPAIEGGNDYYSQLGQLMGNGNISFNLFGFNLEFTYLVQSMTTEAP